MTEMQGLLRQKQVLELIPRNKVVAAYNHADYIPQRQEMMQSWADYLDELREAARAETQ